jgi:hypothetical protein
MMSFEKIHGQDEGGPGARLLMPECGIKIQSVNKSIGTLKASRKGAKPQSPAKHTKELFLAFLCALASLREAVDFFALSRAPYSEIIGG